MDRINIIIYFTFLCFLIIGSLIIYKNFLVNKEKNKWNVKSYKEGMDNFVFLTNTTNNETTRIIETTDFICNYSFEATVLMVARGGDGGPRIGGGGGGYYYNKNFKFTEGHTYTFTIGTDDYTFTDNTNGSTVVCTNSIYVEDRIEMITKGTGRNKREEPKIIKGGPRAGTSVGTGDFLKDKNVEFRNGNDPIEGDNEGGNADAYRPKSNTITIKTINLDEVYKIGGAGGGARKYAANYSGEYDSAILSKMKVVNYDAGGGNGRDSTFGENTEINAWSYGNGGGAGQTRGYAGGKGSNGALIIYYSAIEPIIKTAAPTTPAVTRPKPTTPAPTFESRRLMSVSNMTPIETLDKNEFYIVPLPEKYSGKINSNTSTVSGVDNKNILLYFPNGKYTFTASSTANANTSPYMAFDGDLTTVWQCDINGNKDKTMTKRYNTYKSDPYKLGYYLDDTSPYVGGGDSTTMWTTTVNGIDVGGEWLQLQIPYAAYVHQYSIYTPISSSYPYLFTVVGSNDGINWNYIDQQNEAVSYFDDANQVNVMTFNVNSTDKYSYFRLVITEISKYTSFIQVCSWSIIGGTKLKNMTEMESRIINPITTTPAKSVSNEAFTSLHRSIETRVHRPVFSRVDRHINSDHNYLGYIRRNHFDRGYVNDYLRGDIIYDNIAFERRKQDNIALYLSTTLAIVTLTLVLVYLDR